MCVCVGVGVDMCVCTVCDVDRVGVRRMVKCPGELLSSKTHICPAKKQEVCVCVCVCIGVFEYSMVRCADAVTIWAAHQGHAWTAR